MSKTMRMSLIDGNYDLSVRKQAKLLSIHRSSFYYKPIINDDTELLNLIKESYLGSNCIYGYRKIHQDLQSKFIDVNIKKIRKLMKESEIYGHYPKKRMNTSLGNSSHMIFPYLLEDLVISSPNQVWATDITYIKINDKFFYLIAILDIYSRYIVSYELSNCMHADFCTLALNKALQGYNKPVIFNSDQGAQFTSNVFTEILILNRIEISMDHRGRCFDNIYVERLWRTIKQEGIYYERPQTPVELERCIDDFIFWYNNRRLHQAIGYKTPAQLYVA